MDKPYQYRNPYPNRYKKVVDNNTDMLECPECKCRIQANLFSYAVGDLGYRYCPYCGVSVMKTQKDKSDVDKDQITIMDILGGGYD